MLYRRGKKWSYKFMCRGVQYWGATGYTNRQDAQKVETDRRKQVNDSLHGIVEKPKAVPLFTVAAQQYADAMKPEWQPKTIRNTELVFRLHLFPFFGKQLLSDVNLASVVKYREQRMAEGASAKSISNELGALRALMRFHDLDARWKAIGKKVKLAPPEKVGRCITDDERRALLEQCRASRSRSLYVAVVMALEACMRLSEIRLLRWRNVDLVRRTITVGVSKTRDGEGRVIDMSTLLYAALKEWAMKFPARRLDHFLFPAEKYGEGGKVYATDPTQPIHSWKEAWEAAKKRSGVQCRFHDLRHTGITRLLEAGVDHMMVGRIAGWSTATTIRMIADVYGHIGQPALKRAIQLRRTIRGHTTSRSSPRGGYSFWYSWRFGQWADSMKPA